MGVSPDSSDVNYRDQKIVALWGSALNVPPDVVGFRVINLTALRTSKVNHAGLHLWGFSENDSLRTGQG